MIMVQVVVFRVTQALPEAAMQASQAPALLLRGRRELPAQQSGQFDPFSLVEGECLELSVGATRRKELIDVY